MRYIKIFIFFISSLWTHMLGQDGEFHPNFVPGSGTGWLPAESKMYGKMIHGENWMTMIHGGMFLRYNRQDLFDAGDRGDSKLDAPNWVMVMAQNRISSRHFLRFSGMFSLDPLTMGGEGYPLLFQSGETWKGKPLVDRQHPHNLFAELSAFYRYSFSELSDVSIYAGFPGEPAIGPVAFMHRPAAMDNPDAPISHHWQDATHITFGVTTLGYRYRNSKIEGSVFTGREPNEDRYGFNKPRMDSYSFRFSTNPGPSWALQISHAWVHSPEAREPNEDVQRTTASALYSSRAKKIDLSFVWGFNNAGGDHQEHSFLWEGRKTFGKFDLWSKYEWIQKSGHELDLVAPLDEKKYILQGVTLGIGHTLTSWSGLNLKLGVQGSVYKPDKQLEFTYGKTPLAGQIFLQISPSQSMMYHE